MNEVIERISKIGIVPVLTIDDANTAKAAAGSLARGGIDAAEITFRTPAAEESIKRIASAEPDILLGAGTVTSVECVKRACAAGAKFIVTPGYNPTVVDYCMKNKITIIPGCMDTNTLEIAMEAGIDTIKFFPAEATGGINMLKALSGPYTTFKFIPTGGINKDNMNKYLSFKKVIAIGGSWMANREMISRGRFDEIERLAREAVNTMLDLRVDISEVKTMAMGSELKLITTNKERAKYHLEKFRIDANKLSLTEK